MKLSDMYVYQGIKLYCNALIGNSPKYIIDNVNATTTVHRYNTRQGLNVFKKQIITKLQEQSLNHKLNQTWNQLPNNLKQQNKTVSVQRFLNLVREHIFSSYTFVCSKKNCYSCKQGNQLSKSCSSIKIINYHLSLIHI